MAYTTINKGASYFNTVLYTGDGASTLAITGVGFQPDLIWTKGRNIAAGSVLTDSNRGANKQLQSASTGIEESLTTAHKSFDSDGFTLGDNGNVNTGSKTYVGWNWLAGGTAPSKTFDVVVVSDSGNKYRFRNSGDTATFAESAVTLNLQEGGTYTFDQSDSTNATHPLRFYTASDKTGGEYTTGVTTNGTPGSSGAYTRITIAASAPTLYYQCSSHGAMGGQINTNASFGSTNFDGSIKSVVTANTTAGFSIVTYTGNAVTGTTIGHGLGTAPDLIILKNREPDVANWQVYHSGLGATKYIQLNAQGGSTTSNTRWNDVEPTSTVFTTGSSGDVKGDSSGETFVAYCWREIKGFSRIGTYQGNGNADGPFAHCGFRPAYVIFKRTGSTLADWQCWDTKRDPGNPVEEAAHVNLTNVPSSDQDIDINSNGFKIRSNQGHLNASGETFIYWAFAENPFVSSTGTPVTAR